MHGRKFFFSKIDFFRFFQKWSRMDVNIEYWLEMCFEHFGGLFGTISDRLWCSDGRLKKIDFLKKMQFLRFFGIFEFGRFGYKKASKKSNFRNFSNMHCLYLEDAYRYLRWFVMVCRYDFTDFWKYVIFSSRLSILGYSMFFM